MAKRQIWTPPFSFTWIGWNTFGFSAGFICHAFLAHGITGDHDSDLTIPQFVFHTAGLLVAGAIITSTQRRALRPLLQVRWSAVAFTPIGLTAGFWFGYYLFGIPFDIMFAFVAVGTGLGFMVRPRVRTWRRWTAMSILCFFCGFIVAVAATLPVLDSLLNALGGGLLGEACFWAYLGAAGGAASGAFSYLAIARRLIPSTA